MTQTTQNHIKHTAFLMAIAFATCTAMASPIVMGLDTRFTEDKHEPAGPAPWVEVIFDDQGTVGSVAMTISSMGLVNAEFVSKMHFNMDPRIDAKDLIFTKIDQSGSFKAPSIKLDENKKKAGPAKGFDMELSFGTKDKDQFGAGESLTYLITGSMLIDNSLFAYINTGAKPEDTYYAAAHIQGIGDDYSSRIGAINGPAAVPEPATMLLLATGGAAMLAYHRKRKTIKTQAA